MYHSVFYRIFRSYVGIIADSAINGFERDEQFSTLHIFAHEQAIDAEWNRQIAKGL